MERRRVPNNIEAGTMMVREDLLLPTLDIETDAYSARWRSVKDLSSSGLGRALDAVGWHLFFIGGHINTVAFGRAGEKSQHKAVQRIAAKVKAMNFNCLELTEITRKRFLGLPYIGIRAHAFHVQQGWQLDPARVRSSMPA